MSSNKFLLYICIASTLSMINNSMVSSPLLKNFIYGLMVLFEFKLFLHCKFYNFGGYNIGRIVIPMLFIFMSFLHSNYEPLWGLYIKYIGYILCFIYGSLSWNSGSSIKINKVLLYFTIFTPLILVGLFDKTPHKTVFYTLSNVYSFAGLCFSFYYYTVFYYNKNVFIKSLFLVAIFIISSSTLGILFAFVLSIAYISRRNTKMAFSFVLIFLLILLLVQYSDIQVFQRVKDVVAVFSNMSKEDWRNISELNMWEISKDVDYSSDRTDNTSAIWRLSHWAKLLQDFLKYWYYSLIIGLGDCYTLAVLGNVPHNDYLRFLCEYGLIVFSYIIYYIRQLLRALKNDEALIFIVAFLFYSLSENLINTFASNCLLYFCIGYHYERCKQGNIKSIMYFI